MIPGNAAFSHMKDIMAGHATGSLLPAHRSTLTQRLISGYCGLRRMFPYAGNLEEGWEYLKAPNEIELQCSWV